MQILVAGYGFVGKAHALAFEGKHRVVVHDPDKGYEAVYKDADAVVCAVATPPRKDGSCEMANVYDVVERAPNVPILIKSTISLEGWHMLKDTFPNKKITFSPEFLRAEHAMEDFVNQKHVLLGDGDVDFWEKLFQDCLNVEAKHYPAEELILAKYFRNSFLATKVAFFNQVYDLCKAAKVDYDYVKELVGLDDRIGTTHMDITEQRGFGGHCFPKDTAAIVRTAERNNVDLSIIKEAREYNNKIRKK